MFQLNGKTTDRLLKEALEINENPNLRELDMLLSCGEQITISKLSICLDKLGYNAISLTSWQIPIKTNDISNNADILSININRLLEELKKIILLL